MRLHLYRHLFQQGRGLAAAARLALVSLRLSAPPPSGTPGVWLEQRVPPPGRALVRDTVRECGGDPEAWGEELPPHLFARFGLPLAMRVLAGLPYPVHRALNAGCAWAKRAPLPAGAPLDVRARLETLEADDFRVKAAVRIVAGAAGAQVALEAEMRFFIPLARGQREERRPEGAWRVPAAVPSPAQLVRWLDVGSDAGAVFAALTGDVNPIHWLGPAARAAGFSGCILHGFAMHARAVEALGASLPGGVRSLGGVDVRFTRPLALPAQVGVFSSGRDFFLGPAPGAPANLVGAMREAVASMHQEP